MTTEDNSRSYNIAIGYTYPAHSVTMVEVYTLNLKLDKNCIDSFTCTSYEQAKEIGEQWNRGEVVI